MADQLTWEQAVDQGHIQCLMDGARGVYIPQNFAEMYGEFITDKDDRQILLAGPDHEDYWEAWHTVEQSVEITDDNGHKWALYQDGDLFVIRADIEIDWDSM